MKVLLLSPDLGEDRHARAQERLRGKVEVVIAPSRDAVAASLPGADAYLCAGVAGEFPEADVYDRVRYVQTSFAGVDHLPFERIPDHIAICSNAGAFNTSLGEHAFALVLAAAKRVVEHAADLRAGRFPQDRKGKQLRGSVLGIIGLGGIGTEVARMGRAFGMTVMGINRRGTSEFPADFVGGPGDLARVLEAADVLVVAVPHTKATHHLLTARELARMKEDAVLVNVARGDIVREEDLYDHLKAHPDFRAAFDVWWRYPKGPGYPHHRPFHELPNFFGTPHVAWNVPPQRHASLDHALDNVEAWLDGRPLRNVVARDDYSRRGTQGGAEG